MTESLYNEKFICICDRNNFEGMVSAVNTAAIWLRLHRKEIATLDHFDSSYDESRGNWVVTVYFTKAEAPVPT